MLSHLIEFIYLKTFQKTNVRSVIIVISDWHDHYILYMFQDLQFWYKLFHCFLFPSPKCFLVLSHYKYIHSHEYVQVYSRSKFLNSIHFHWIFYVWSSLKNLQDSPHNVAWYKKYLSLLIQFQIFLSTKSW